MIGMASQYKYSCAKLSRKVCYEAANLMGGIGFTDNTLMDNYLRISRTQEIIGGSRQVQQLLMSRALRRFYKQI